MTDPADIDGASGTIWWLYMIECRGGGIYTGIAIDVDLRYEKHASGRGARYTPINPPVRLLCRHPFSDRQSAARAEYVIKRLSSERKWAMATSGSFGEAVAATMARRQSR
jgi:putative endonuclease